MRADEVIIAPVLSEKSNAARDGECKKYTFRINTRANKFDVESAVAEIFKVSVTKCNIMIESGRASCRERV